MTVGLAEVEAKRSDWRRLAKTDRERFLVHHAIPVVRGPGERLFLTDHHHLGRALIEEKVERCFVTLQADLARLAPDEFWLVMEHRQWVHSYDAEGHRCPFADIPRKLTKLADDPYRSLAAAVRDHGGYAKDTEPFAEFLWADFFRRRLPLSDLKDHPDRTLWQAVDLSHTPEAAHLPGWSGVSSS